MAVTNLSNLVNPQVVADTLTAQLPSAIKFSPICEVNKDLVGTPGNTISVPKYAYIGDAVDELSEEEVGERKFLFVPPVFMGILRTDPTWTHASELGDKTLMTGCVGMVYGCEVIPTKRITADSSDVYKCVLAKEGAVALYLKRDVNVETGRDITHKTTLITADEHYVTALRDENRCIVLKAKLPTAVKTRKAALKPTSEPSQG